MAKQVFDKVKSEQPLGNDVIKELAKFEINRPRPEWQNSRRIWATRAGNRWNTIGVESASGRADADCLVKAETDLDGNLYRAYVGYST